jgi:branched-chain amino acid transport system substrate-binding protein
MMKTNNRRITRKILLTLITALIMIFVSACNTSNSSEQSSTGGNSNQSTPKNNSGDSGSDEMETIKIGMTSALTGAYSEYGEGNRRGVELAIEKWNANGGINGRKIELAMLLDDQLVPDKAAVNMQQILENEEIVAVIGPAGSGPTLATVPMTEAKGMVHINPVAQTPSVTYPNGTDKPPRKNVFSFALQNDVETEVLATFAGEHWKKIGLVHESTAYGKSGMDLVEKVLKEELSIEPVAREEYNQKTPDMTAQLARIKKAGAEVVVVVGLGADLANIRKGMSRLNMDVPLVATNGALSLPYKEGAGDLVVGTIGTMVGALGQDPLSLEAQEFADAYEKKYGKDRFWGNGDKPQLFMSLNVANAYDGANVLFEAIKRANNTESSEIIKAMESIKNFKGVNAIYSFSETKHHAIGTDGLGLFEYVKDGDTIKLVPYQD